MQRVGVVAIQGDFEKHLIALKAVGVEAVEVRTPDDLATVERAILPGGESTAVGLLLQRFGLGEAIIQRASEGLPLWGTCMGMILMAKEIEDHDSQYTLGILDISVRRNAFGRQIHSFEDEVSVDGLDGSVTGVFIRAPVVTRLGAGVESLARYQDAIVAVRQGKRVGTSFHPELTADTRMHEWFVGL